MFRSRHEPSFKMGNLGNLGTTPSPHGDVSSVRVRAKGGGRREASGTKPLSESVPPLLCVVQKREDSAVRMHHQPPTGKPSEVERHDRTAPMTTTLSRAATQAWITTAIELLWKLEAG